MASVRIEKLCKTFDEKTNVVDDVSVCIRDNEFVVIVGPSGCGKTTTLNIIAGLEKPSSGHIFIDDECVDDVEPKDRNIAMMSTLKKLHDSGVVALASSWDDIIAKFYSGEAAGVIGGSWWAPVIAANEDHFGLWRVAPIPTMTGSSEYKNYSSCGGCSWYVINNDNSKVAIDFLTDTIAVSDEIADKLVASNQVVPALKTAFSVPSATAGDP